MKFKIDENMPAEVVSEARLAGHEADSVHDEGLTGRPDHVILARIQTEGRVILTMDKGIADVRKYPPNQFAGIVLFRPKTKGRKAVLALVQKFLPALLQLDLTGRLFVVSESGIRVR